MKIISQSWVDAYLQNDTIQTMLDKKSYPTDERLQCQKWLRDIPPKRAIFQELYGDLLRLGNKTVLDIGGGITGLTRVLSEKNDFTLVDLLAHDNKKKIDAFLVSSPNLILSNQDWYKFVPQKNYDVVVANDLFPNADQRLELFIERFLPYTKEIRLSLTYYNTPRYYITKRIDAEEILCVLAWNGDMTCRTLEKFSHRINKFSSSLFTENPVSLYPNGRQVCLVTIQGEVCL